MMVRFAEKRFGALRAPFPAQVAVQPTESSSSHPGAPPCACCTRAGSQSNGVADAFAENFRREYVRVNPISDALTCPCLIDIGWRTIIKPCPHVPGCAIAYPEERNPIGRPVLTGSTSVKPLLSYIRSLRADCSNHALHCGVGLVSIVQARLRRAKPTITSHPEPTACAIIALPLLKRQPSPALPSRIDLCQLSSPSPN